MLHGIHIQNIKLKFKKLEISRVTCLKLHFKIKFLRVFNFEIRF